jgi:hypothetical protein
MLYSVRQHLQGDGSFNTSKRERSWSRRDATKGQTQCDGDRSPHYSSKAHISTAVMANFTSSKSKPTALLTRACCRTRRIRNWNYLCVGSLNIAALRHTLCFKTPDLLYMRLPTTTPLYDTPTIGTIRLQTASNITFLWTFGAVLPKTT